MDTSDRLIRVLRTNLTQATKDRQFTEARNLIEELRAMDPLSVETRGLELELLIASAEISDALKLANQLLHTYPDSARIQYLAGRVLYRNRNYRDALQCFTESDRLHNHPRTRRWIGKTLTQSGQFTDAEAILVGLADDLAAVQLDLAWLYERMDQPVRALEHVNTHLQKHPDDEFARQQKLRLTSVLMDPGALAGDVETMLELDESVPPEILPVYIRSLLLTGRADRARDFINRQKSILEPTAAVATGWVCHKLAAYDLAMDLFIAGLHERLNDVKFLSALESAARHCNRCAELIELYEPLAETEKRLYGRIKRLLKTPEG